MMIDDRNHVRIRSIGLHLPTRRESNYEKAEQLGFDRSFLENKLGVVSRSVMEPGETTSDLAIRAFNALVERIELPLDEIQLLVVVTQHPDFKVPHTSAMGPQPAGTRERLHDFRYLTGMRRICACSCDRDRFDGYRQTRPRCFDHQRPLFR